MFFLLSSSASIVLQENSKAAKVMQIIWPQKYAVQKRADISTDDDEEEKVMKQYYKTGYKPIMCLKNMYSFRNSNQKYYSFIRLGLVWSVCDTEWWKRYLFVYHMFIIFFIFGSFDEECVCVHAHTKTATATVRTGEHQPANQRTHKNFTMKSNFFHLFLFVTLFVVHFELSKTMKFFGVSFIMCIKSVEWIYRATAAAAVAAVVTAAAEMPQKWRSYIEQSEFRLHLLAKENKHTHTKNGRFSPFLHLHVFNSLEPCISKSKMQIVCRFIFTLLLSFFLPLSFRFECLLVVLFRSSSSWLLSAFITTRF